MNQCVVYECIKQPWLPQCLIIRNDINRPALDNFYPSLRAEALDSGKQHEEIVKYMINISNESNSNLTQMNEKSLDRLASMGVITIQERESIMPIITEITRNSTEENVNQIDVIQNKASDLLKNLYENNASLAAIGIASVLNNSISLTAENDITHSDIFSTIGLDTLCAITIGILDPVSNDNWGTSGYCSAGAIIDRS
jgi:hypothetical protein